MSSCMWLAGICRKTESFPDSPTCFASHFCPQSTRCWLVALLGSYGVYSDISCLSCLHLNSQLLVCSLLRAGLQGELEHPLPGPDCLVATRAPWSLFLSLFSLVFKENLQSFLSSCSDNQGFRYMPGVSQAPQMSRPVWVELFLPAFSLLR